MISQPATDSTTVVDSSDDYSYMEQGDITITLTMVEHEILREIIDHAKEVIQLIAPYGGGLHDLPLENEVVQRVSTVHNLSDRINTLWSYRYHENEPISEV